MKQELTFRFYDVEIQVSSDSGHFLDVLRQLHGAGLINSALSPARSLLTFELYLDAGSAPCAPAIVRNGRVFPIKVSPAVFGHAYLQMLQLVTQSIKSHILVHAGAVSCCGQGVVLVADTMHGKTTLVLELIRRGFEFLSDDIAAFGRADGNVFPFPRSLSIRPGTLELIGLPRPAGATQWHDKLVADMDDILPGRKGRPVPVAHVVALQSHPQRMAAADADGEQELSIVLERVDEKLLAAIEQIEGVDYLSVDMELLHPVIRLHCRRKLDRLNDIETVCQARGILVLDYITRQITHPEFDLPARLEPYPRSQATMDLVRHFRAGHRSALLDSEDGTPLSLFMELASITANADCHRLYVGSLSQNADLVRSLTEELE